MRRCGKGDKDRGLSENRFDRGPICFTQWPKGKGATQAGRSWLVPRPRPDARRRPRGESLKWTLLRCSGSSIGRFCFSAATLILFIGSTAAGVVARRPWAQADIGRTGRIRSRPQCDDDAARIVDRLRHCDGGQPLRPAQEPGGIRGERDRHGIPPARPHAGRRGVQRAPAPADLCRRTHRLLRAPRSRRAGEERGRHGQHHDRALGGDRARDQSQSRRRSPRSSPKA